MHLATQPRFALVLLVILTVGLPLGSLAEGDTETTYDESETAPYLSMRPFSIEVPLEAAAATTQRVPRSLQLSTCLTSLFVPAFAHGTAVHRPSDAQVAFELLCTIRC